MNSQRPLHAIRDDIAAALAEIAGVDRSNRIYSRFEDEAFSLVETVRYRAPDRPEGPIRTLLDEAYTCQQTALEENARIAREQALLWEQFQARREADSAPPPGFAFVHVRDEITRKLFRLTLPVEQVNQVGN